MFKWKQLAFISTLLLGLCKESYSSDSTRVHGYYSFLEEGIHLFDKKNYREALINIDSAIRLNKNCTECYYVRADINIAVFHKDDAIKDYKEIIKIAPDNYLPYYKLGKLHHQYKNYIDAIYFYNLCIDRDSLNEHAYVNRAVCKEKLDRFEDASKDLLRAIKLDPTDADAYFDLAEVRVLQDKLKDALPYINQCIDLRNRDDESYLLRGNILEELGKHEKAIEDFTVAIEINPNNAAAYFERGRAHVILAEFDIAEKEFTKALELNPEYADAYYELAVIYSELNKKKKIKENLDNAMNLNAEYCAPELLEGIDVYFSGDKSNACSSWGRLSKKNIARYKADELIGKYCTEAQTRK